MARITRKFNDLKMTTFAIGNGETKEGPYFVKALNTAGAGIQPK
jgi:hypothetical protein